MASIRRTSVLASHLQVNPTAGGDVEVKKAGKGGVDPYKGATSLAAADLFNVRGKTALVTGGSRGIGEMIAAALVENGARVFICSRKVEACEKVTAELNAMAQKSASGGSAVSLPGNLSSVEGVLKVVEDLSKRTNALHILVNNAGATWGAPLEEYPDEAWQKVMDLNVRHVFNLTQKCLPLLKAGSRGSADPARVINIASVDGMRATQTAGPTAAFAYTTSKGAVIHLTKSLMRALAPFKITCNCVCPGVFPSKMTAYMLTREAGANIAAELNPMKRVGMTSDMAGTLLYLCSKAGAWTNGAVIPLDGGQHLAADSLGT